MYNEDEDEDEEIIPPINGITFPETVGECIDKLYALRTQRLIAEKEIKETKRTENAFHGHIITTLRKAKLEGGQGITATASITETDVPTPSNWVEIHQYIIDNNAFDLLQKRLSTTAIKERWDQGEIVPGVDKFHKVDVSLTKRGR